MENNLAIIVLNYNSYDDCVTCIQSIRQYTPIDYTIVLIDNCSSDGSYERLYERYNQDKDICMLRSASNNGYACGNNIGIAWAKEHLFNYICICNPDMILIEDVFSPLLNYVSSNSTVVAVSPLTLNPDYTPNALTARTRDTLLTRLFEYPPLSKMDIWGIRRTYFYNFNYEGPMKVHTLWGCFMLFKMDVFQQLGQLDEHTFLYEEEPILFTQIADHTALGDVVLYTEAKIIHNHKVQPLSVTHFQYFMQSERYFLSHILKMPFYKRLLIYLLRGIQLAFLMIRKKRS